VTFGSLFAGIGGMDLGLERAGMQCAWQVENYPYCNRVLAKHWPDVRRHDDIRTFPPEGDWTVDLVCGGFPCQPVSCAGRRAGDTDDRWLWPEMHRVCEVVRPRWVLAENVPGLLSASTGRIFGEILRDLAALGYRAEWDCIPAAAVGAPHIRDRVFILAHASEARQYPRRPQQSLSRFGAHGEDGDVADAKGQSRDDGNGGRGGAGRLAIGGCSSIARRSWAVEPDVGRVAHGVPARVDRLRCLGNAVVPQVAEFIGRTIMKKDNSG
jgi:DNA (cytosine-5)-methyltransferase 1